MADTTHVGWKTEPVKDDQSTRPENGGRVQGRTSGLQATGQGRPVCRHDQIDVAQPLTSLPSRRNGPRFLDCPAEGCRQNRALPATAPGRDERLSRLDVRREAVDCFWGSAPRARPNQKLRAIAQFPAAEKELINGRLDQGREFTDLVVKQFAAQLNLTVFIERFD
jgi:hypothetical protein